MSARACARLVSLATALLFALPAAGGPAPEVRGRYVTVRGLRLYYETHGAVRPGERPLVLLHGGGGSGRQFAKQIPAFASTRRLIVPDEQAQGRTFDRPRPLTYHGMAEDVLALLDRLGVREADVLGWSDGGVVGLDLAMHHPGRVVHLVTFGANFRADGLQPADVAWNRTATPDSFGPGMREGWTKENPQPRNYAVAMTKLIALWREQPAWTTADLGRIRAKVLVCAGEHDVVRDEHTRALAAAIPGAQVWIVPGASHGAMLEQPELVNAKVLEFLSR